LLGGQDGAYGKLADEVVKLLAILRESDNKPTVGTLPINDAAQNVRTLLSGDRRRFNAINGRPPLGCDAPIAVIAAFEIL
jgi:hypothetical protein